MRRLRILLPILALAAAALPTPAAAQAQGPGCAEALGALGGALPAAPLNEVVRLYRVGVQPACSGLEGPRAARSVALRHMRDAGLRRQQGAPPSELASLLRAGIAISAEPWQLHDALGDVLLGMGDFTAATEAYQLAMNASHHLAPGLAEPPRAVVQQMIDKAQQARMLAPAVVPLPPTRDGSPGGLGLRSLRGVAIEAVAQPIHFVTGSAEPTREGAQAIQQLMELLRAEDMPPVRLVGHTDERGSHELNDALSLARAQRVAQILHGAGYPADRLRVEGRGKREAFRFVAVPGVHYTQEQRWQLDRRVELVR